MALGELIEGKGMTTGHRVLDVEGPKIEVSFAMTGKYRGGVETSDLGTYCSVIGEGSEPEAMYGEAQEVITSRDGQGMATWTGQGIGRIAGAGKIGFRGSIFFRTTSTSASLVFLNMKQTSKGTAR